jgi:hypothetical protein
MAGIGKNGPSAIHANDPERIKFKHFYEIVVYR